MTEESESRLQHYFSTQPDAARQHLDFQIDLAGLPFHITTAAGVFSFHGLDKGTSVLLRKAPPLPESGVFVDLGCGWGPLALVMARLRPQAQVYAIDVNPHALELTKRNAELNQLSNIEVLSAASADTHFSAQCVDVIWSNPPIRVGKDKLHQILDSWQPRLKPQGEALLVVGKNLGSDTLLNYLNQNGWQGHRLGSSKGFRVLQLCPKTQDA